MGEPTAAAAAMTGDDPGLPRVGRRAMMRQLVLVAPLGLVIVAEAAWIAVLGGLVQLFTLHDAVLGVPALAAFVLAGASIARFVGPRLGSRWPVAALGFVAAGAALGWAWSDDARATLTLGDLGGALAAHPGGLIAGLAVLRGFAHARLPLAEGTVTNLLALGVPGLAAASLLGGLITEPFRSHYLADALGDAIVFVAAAALALALARLDAIGLDGGFDWRRNPGWLLLAVAILVLAIALAVPLAAVAGSVVSILVSVAIGPLFLVGIVTGFDRVLRRLAILGIIVVVLLLIVIALFGHPGQILPTVVQVEDGSQQQSPIEQLASISLGGVLLLAGIIGIVVLVALWMRRTPPPDDDLDEERAIDPSGVEPIGRWWNRRAGRAAPRSAVEAYLALLRDVERHPAVRREPGETPAAHAARIRGLSDGLLGLDLLAADFALVRYAGVDLTPPEDARGIRRWRSLRVRLARLARATARRPGASRVELDLPKTATDAEGARTGTRAGG